MDARIAGYRTTAGPERGIRVTTAPANVAQQQARFAGPPATVAEQTALARRPAKARLVRTRVLSAVALAGLAYLLISGGVAGYHLAQDSFIAPAILSPSSDVVLASKLKLGEIEVERARCLAELEGLGAELAAIQKASGRLAEFQRTAMQFRRWSSRVSSERASSGASQLEALRRQERVIRQMIEKQGGSTERARADAAAGLIPRSDYAREAQALSHLELAMLENRRAIAQTRSTLHEASLAQRALAAGDKAPQTPELAARQEQWIRVELELNRLQADERAKRAQRRALEDRIAKLNQIARELRSRPVYRAIERSVDVAFVPYSQIEGVAAGAPVYSCVWGLFACEEVGRVAEVLPGEVVLTDPWGTPARGQYALLALTDREAAKAKTLRVRAESQSSAPVALRPRTKG